MSHYWFISKTNSRLTQLAFITLILACVVILLGAYTRLTNAGLSCPDWPNCFGYLTAPHTQAELQSAQARFPTTEINVKKAWTEMTHRYFAGTEGVLMMILSLALLMQRPSKEKKPILLATSLLLLLGVQVTLGMLTVTEKLKPVIVLSHLLTGLSILCILWLTYLHLRPSSRTNMRSPRLLPWLWLGLIIVIMQITLGGWVSTHYAGLACIDFPYCNGKLVPTMQWHQLNSDLITIHMLHRIGAFITASYLALLSLLLWQKPNWRPIATLLLALIALQLTLGILNIIWLRPVWIALIHHGIAIVILLTIIMTIVKANSHP